MSAVLQPIREGCLGGRRSHALAILPDAGVAGPGGPIFGATTADRIAVETGAD